MPYARAEFIGDALAYSDFTLSLSYNIAGQQLKSR